jgi:four helix bundle protein
MNDERLDLRKRTKKFALQIVRLYVALPKTTEAQILGKQLIRSGTSIGAHYHEATRARSTAEFVSKIEGALQELEETIYWIDLLTEADILQKEIAQPHLREADELLRILVSSAKTAKEKLKVKK